jgi:HK97 gp10 family phage protein
MASITTNGITVEFADNSEEVLRAVKNAVERGLKACGETAVGYAQDKCPVQTGNLKGSITYAVDGDDVYIGTNVNYAPYVELGTGIYASGGRKTPWTYKGSDGNFYTTNGMKAQPFLQPAAANHSSEYMSILKDSLENA